jgi:hypothetical protein
MIGAAYDTNNNYYADGLVDDVRFWNQVRTTTQMNDNFETELTGSESGLVAYYRLNDSYNDSTANAYNLSSSGSPVFSSGDVPFSPAAPTGVRKGATETLSSDNTVNDDSDLSISLFANREYVIDGIVFASSTSAQPDIKIAFQAPDEAVVDIGVVASTMREAELLQGSGAQGVETDGISISANKPIAIQIVGTVKTGSSGGTLTLQWAQNASSAAAIGVLRGSYLRADEI